MKSQKMSSPWGLDIWATWDHKTYEAYDLIIYSIISAPYRNDKNKCF